jgi:glycosyltransferase involved in cell wall biosynthesis
VRRPASRGDDRHRLAQRGARLPARVENLLACDYPHDRLQIIVASDGSTDDTAAALAPFAAGWSC